MPDQNQGEVLDFVGLDQGGRLEDLVQRAEAPRHGDEGVRVFHQHQFPHEKVFEGDPFVEIRVRLLFLRQLDVAADGVAARFLGTAIGRLHDSGSAARHDGEPGPREPLADVASQNVGGVFFGKAGRAENGDAGREEMELAEASHDLEKDADRPPQLEPASLRPPQELPDFRRRGGPCPNCLRSGWLFEIVRRVKRLAHDASSNWMKEIAAANTVACC